MIWQAVPRANFIFLRAARLQAHHAVQWPARVARAVLPRQAGDRHESLGWDGAFGGFATHPLPDGSRLGLRIADLTLAFLDHAPAVLSLDGRAESEVRHWVEGQVASRKFIASNKLAKAGFDRPLAYAIPDHALVRGARYSLDEMGEAFSVLATWAANAASALDGVRERLAAQRIEAQEVRCWPHHFDLDCVAALGRGRTMSVGYSPGDEFCDEPYFYTSMWPEPPIPKLPLLPAIAHWHTYKFLAALAPAHKIVAAGDQGTYVRQFLDVSVKAARDALG